MAAAKQQKPRLARGLSALLGESEQANARPPPRSASNDLAPRKLAVEKLRRNADQPRQKFDEPELEELTNSVRKQGIISPIIVRPDPKETGAYQIVAGERRWRAAQKADLAEVPVIIRDLKDREALEVSLVENVQRKDLNPIEEAMGYRALIDEFSHTQDAIAKAVGKSRPYIANALRLLQLPNRVRDLVYEGELSAGHARAIAAAPNCEALAERIVAEGLTVRDAEKLAREAAERAEPEGEDDVVTLRSPNRTPSKDQITLELEKTIAKNLGMAVDIRNHGDAGGEVRIRFAGGDQLREIVRRLQTSSAY